MGRAEEDKFLLVGTGCAGSLLPRRMTFERQQFSKALHFTARIVETEAKKQRLLRSMNVY